jgi:hypothetical protein
VNLRLNTLTAETQSSQKGRREFQIRPYPSNGGVRHQQFLMRQWTIDPHDNVRSLAIAGRGQQKNRAFMSTKMKAAQISKHEQMHSGRVRFRVVLMFGG